MTEPQRATFHTIGWAGDQVELLDQIALPEQILYRRYETPAEVAQAIRDMVIRGAPAIGIAGAMGMALAVLGDERRTTGQLIAMLDDAGELLAQSRPTAVNLFWAIERMRNVAHSARDQSPEEFRRLIKAESQAILDEDVAANREMGRHGSALLPNPVTVLTHCNAGALATGGYGTALGVVRAAVEAGQAVKVFACETRPYLQGARLTTWELAQDGIATTLITDNMAGFVMAQGLIDAVIVGTDRVIANGDVANKIGTYSLAVLARENGVPFYVAAPRSTIDLRLQHGEDIAIEERTSAELCEFRGVRTAPEGQGAYHPAFDVTPHRYVTAFITECGVVRPPYRDTLRALFS